ncbi:MAG: hypothetical protein AAFV86_23000 [Pseudomonadota bacterium]
MSISPWSASRISTDRRAAQGMAAAGVLAGRGGPAPFEDTCWICPDVIRPGDPTAFCGLDSLGRGTRDLPDRRRGEDDAAWGVDGVHLMTARYDDGHAVEVAVNEEFGAALAARSVAARYALALGQLPRILRLGVCQLVIHRGDQPFGGLPGVVLVHHGEGRQLDADGFLEAALFHEAVHAALDAAEATSPGWLAAAEADGAHISTSAAADPEAEDLAESALPAYAVLARMHRVDPEVAYRVRRTIPNRIAYLARLGLAERPDAVLDLGA